MPPGCLLILGTSRPGDASGRPHLHFPISHLSRGTERREGHDICLPQLWPFVLSTGWREECKGRIGWPVRTPRPLRKCRFGPIGNSRKGVMGKSARKIPIDLLPVRPCSHVLTLVQCGPSPRLAPRQRYIRGDAAEDSDRGHFPWPLITAGFTRGRVLGERALLEMARTPALRWLVMTVSRRGHLLPPCGRSRRREEQARAGTAWQPASVGTRIHGQPESPGGLNSRTGSPGSPGSDGPPWIDGFHHSSMPGASQEPTQGSARQGLSQPGAKNGEALVALGRLEALH